MMNYALIKDNTCINIVVFDDEAPVNAFKEVFRHDGVCDDIVLLADGFGIGDIYENSEWSKQIPPDEPETEPDNTPTPEERIAALEMAMSFMLGM